MNFPMVKWCSLKTKITLFTLLIFLIGIWALSFYVIQTLHKDMERLLSEQQLSAVSFVAAAIDQEMEIRLRGLEKIAQSANPAILENPATLRALMEKHPTLLDLFNAGISYRKEGRNITGVRKGENSSASYPGISLLMQDRSFAMEAPIHNAQGEVIGALVGLVNLSIPSYLEDFTQNRYGKTGGYRLIEPQSRLIVMGAESSTVMQKLPPPGSNPALEKFLLGYEGSAIYTDPFGVEVLASAKRIPSIGWIIEATMPTDVAFAPILNMQKRMLLATLFLTVLVASLTWWMLRRQLAPMLQSVKAIANISDTKHFPQLLPITSQDEVGELIGGFNHLLLVLKEREVELSTSTEWLDEAQSISHVGNWTLDLISGKLFWSNEAFKIFEIDPNQFGASYEAFLNAIHPDDRDAVNQAYTNSLIKRMPYEITHRLRMSDGRIKWVLEKCMSYFDATGKPLMSKGMIQDVTERKLVEDQLLHSMQLLKEEQVAKTRFLAAAGHDLRQPVAAATMFVETLKLTSPTQHQSEIIMRLEQSMTVFSDLLKGLLDISRFDSGLVKQDIYSFDMTELFQWLEQNFEQTALDKQLSFRTFLPMNKPLVVSTDCFLMQSVLRNLISNAIKFTDHGGILISARLRGNNLLLQVWDTGIGIAEAELPYIFDEFYQVDNPQRNRESGLGLGLSICQRAISLLGGEVTCHSRLGRGSVFEFNIPLDADQHEIHTLPINNNRAAEISEMFMGGKRVVVLEDDLLVATGLVTLLQELGADVQQFFNAEEAMLHTDIDSADFFIVDYALGGVLTGLQFLEVMQQKKQALVSAVVLTGETSAQFIRDVANSPWPVLHKPINYVSLAASLLHPKSGS